MKLWPLAVLLVASAVHAETFPLREVPSTTERPQFVTRTRECDPNGITQLRTLTATITGGEVEVHRDCDGIPAMTSLAIRLADHWFVADAFTIADFGANMTDTPLEIHRVRESLTPGSFADGSPAIVYRVITRHDSVRRCHSEGCKDQVVASEKFDHFLVCSLHDTVECGRIEYLCPKTGCGAPSFVKGRLVAVKHHVYVPEAGE